MLILLVLWVPRSHDTIVEFYLSGHLRSKLSPGFDELSDKTEVYSIYKRYMHDLFYPDQYEGTNTTYDTTQKLSFAQVDRLGQAGFPHKAPEPELFVVGQVCITM